MSEHNRSGIFDRSSKTQRSPSTTDVSNPKLACNICDDATEGQKMVECSLCKQWCHFRCVGVDDSIENYVWLCKDCPEFQLKRSTQGNNVRMCVRCQKAPKKDSMIKCSTCGQTFHGKCVSTVSNVTQSDNICIKCHQDLKRIEMENSSSSQQNKAEGSNITLQTSVNTNEVPTHVINLDETVCGDSSQNEQSRNDGLLKVPGSPTQIDGLPKAIDNSSLNDKSRHSSSEQSKSKTFETPVVPLQSGQPPPTSGDSSHNAAPSQVHEDLSRNAEPPQRLDSSQNEKLSQTAGTSQANHNNSLLRLTSVHIKETESDNNTKPKPKSVNSKSSRKSELVRMKLALLEEEQMLNKKQQENIRKQIELIDNMSCSSGTTSIDDDQEEKEKSVEDWVDTTLNTTIAKARVGFSPHDATAGEKSFNRAIYTDNRRNMNSTVSVDPRVSFRKIEKRVNSSQRHSGLNSSGNMLDFSHLVTRQVVSRKLPEFSGDPIEWPVFITTYLDSTEKCGLSNEENLMRLKASLKGNALEQVRSLLLLPGAVPKVIETLSLKYGEPEIIINVHLQKIRSQKQVTSENLDHLVDFALSVQNFCTIVEVMGEVEHLRNPILLLEMLSKLPANLRMDWVKFKEEKHYGNMNLTIFKDWIMNIANYASKANVSFKTSFFDDSRQSGKKPEKTRKNFVHNAQAKVDDKPNPSSSGQSSSSSQSSSSVQSSKCEMCDRNGHLISECNKFLELSKVKRWEVILDKRLCRRCLMPHAERRCKSSQRCGVDGCKTRHNHLLHNERSKRSQTAETQNTTEQEHTVATTRNDLLQRPKVLFHVIPVTLHGPRGSITTFAFLDSGSEITLLSQTTAKEIGLEGTAEKLCLKWTNDTVRTVPNSMKVRLQISGRKKEKLYDLIDVRTTDQLSLPAQSISLDDLKRYEHIRGLPIEPYEDAKPTLLIGLDNWHVATTLEVREGKPADPIATRTRLGWVMFGNLPASTKNTFYNCHQCECQFEESLHQMVKDFFNIESTGVSSTIKPLESEEDTKSRTILENTLKFDGTRYEVGLLWRCENVELPDSYGMAMRRLDCLEKKLMRDQQLRSEYSKQIDNYIKNNYIRKATPGELFPSKRSWYLPTFVVRNPNKPKKLRIVWDAAAAVQNVSLNTFLFKGPDLITSLPDILGRFRQGKIAVTGDLKEMFHQVKVREQDQPSQLFLWRDCDVSRKPDVYVMKVLSFGATCSPACAIYVKNHNALKYKDKHPEATKAITENHYVDDWLQSVDDESSAIILAKQVRTIHEAGGFEIRGWRSNSTEVLRELGETKITDAKDFENQDEHVKVLGLWWKPQNDVFCFKFNPDRVDKAILSGKRCPTKREVLRTVMLIFDPLGLIGFFTVQGKMLLQEIWTTKVGWDDRIKNAQEKKWQNWVSKIPDICDVEIERWYGASSSNVQRLQLHVFVDASISAYAAVAYLRLETTSGVHVSLVGSKTKVAPLRPMSVPRLELMGAVLGVRHAKSIVEGHSLNFESISYWTDSQTVVKWLNSSTKMFKQFVGLRIGEILEYSNVNQWKWLSTKLNVADEATKFHPNIEISSTTRWFSGPSFLQEPTESWPKDSYASDDEEWDEEMKVVAVKNIPTHAAIDASKFSDWRRLSRVYAYLRRFVQNLRQKKLEQPLNLGPLKMKEIEAARNELIKMAQYESYADDIRLLRENPNSSLPKNSRLRKLSPYLDENGIIRVRGRIDAAPNIPFHQKRPVVLPAKHPVTDHLLNYYHRKFCHLHHDTALNEVNQRYYIRKLRPEMKRIRMKCQFCSNNAVKPIAPEMGDLPFDRLASFTSPFAFTGVDLFGPMFVTVARHVEKRYGGLFTCLTTRAIHLELIESLTTSSFINALRCFIVRKGPPNAINCDNATNFKGASKELKNELNEISKEKVKEYFHEIDWEFIPPASPHMGGSWERLIGSVKRVLDRVLLEQKPRVETLRTALIEVEGIMNSRPLTYVAVEHDALEAITPNHFLLLSSNGIKPPGVYDDSPRTLEANWRMSQQIADRYWRRWVAEYLPLLTTRSKWHNKVTPVKVGDVVVIYEDGIRNSWKKGVIVDTNKGSGEQVRSAVIKTQNGLYTRPVTKIAVLAVKGKPSGQEEFTGGSVTASIDRDSRDVHPEETSQCGNTLNATTNVNQPCDEANS